MNFRSHDDAGTVARCDGGIGLKLGAQRIIVRDPVAAQLIEHASPNLILSEGVVHAFLLRFLVGTKHLSTDKSRSIGTGIIWLSMKAQRGST